MFVDEMMEDKIKVAITSFLLLFLHIIPQTLFLVPGNINICKIVLLSILNIGSFLTYIFLLLSHFKKGYIFLDEEEQNLVERRSIFCKKCNQLKPERAHHCRRCQRCIKRMDHHCPWIGSCVNQENQASFIRFLFFGGISCSVLSFYLSFKTVLYFLGKYVIKNYFKVGVLFLSNLISVFLACILISFFYLQLKNVIRNITFIELEQYKDMKRYGFECPKNPYDMGWKNNLREILGNPYLLYLFGERTNGLNYNKTYACDEWPPFKFGIRYPIEVVDNEDVL